MGVLAFGMSRSHQSHYNSQIPHLACHTTIGVFWLSCLFHHCSSSAFRWCRSCTSWSHREHSILFLVVACTTGYCISRPRTDLSKRHRWSRYHWRWREPTNGFCRADWKSTGWILCLSLDSQALIGILQAGLVSFSWLDMLSWDMVPGGDS